MIINDDDFLEHYGVKGMKWGVRKKRESSSTASSGTNSVEAGRRGLTDKQKKALKIGVAVGAVAGGAILTAAIMNKTSVSPRMLYETAQKGKNFIQSPPVRQKQEALPVSLVQRMVKLDVDQTPAVKNARRASVKWLSSDAEQKAPSKIETGQRTVAMLSKVMQDLKEDQAEENVRARRESLRWT